MRKPAMLLLTLFALPMLGCEDDQNVVIEKDKMPATPQGVYSVTGDHSVTVYWNGIYETDVDHYHVYRSLDSINGYASIASVTAEPNPNLNLLIYNYDDNTAANGTKYWYAVTAVDHAGQESELSAEDVYDTPRPEGIATVLPLDIAPAAAGFNLAAHQIVAWNSSAADTYVDRTFDVFDVDTVWHVYLNAGLYTPNQTDIQDLGFTNNWTDVGWAPDSGWSALGYCEAIEGHTYIIWTSDSHYAKVRITSISSSSAVSFQWAWQSVQDNLELAPPVRPPHTDEFGQPKRTVAGQLIK